TCRAPARTTATRKASNEPRVAICAATTAVKPAAGPLTLVCEPLSTPTKIPPTMPAMRPAMGGALDASATPRQSGRATRKTTRPAMRSLGSVEVDLSPVMVGGGLGRCPLRVKWAWKYVFHAPFLCQIDKIDSNKDFLYS